jgi:hypothetical protein
MMACKADSAAAGYCATLLSKADAQDVLHQHSSTTCYTHQLLAEWWHSTQQGTTYQACNVTSWTDKQLGIVPLQAVLHLLHTL